MPNCESTSESQHLADLIHREYKDALIVVVSSPLAPPAIEALLVAICDRVNLTLVNLRPSQSGLLGHWACSFAIRHPDLRLDDFVIYSLLQDLPVEIQWVEVRREPRLRLPDELRDLLGLHPG